MYCGNCRAVIEADWSFCDQCGSRVTQNRGPENAVPSNPTALSEQAQQLRSGKIQPVKRPSPRAVQRPTFLPPPHRGRSGAPRDIIGHWGQLIQGLETSPKAFYSLVRDAIERRKLADTNIEQVEWPEGSFFSPRRLYLRVWHKDHVFDICGAPFGSAFFVSWWLGERRNMNLLWPILMFCVTSVLAYYCLFRMALWYGAFIFLLGFAGIIWFAGIRTLEVMDNFMRSIPIIGPFYETLIHPATYYRVDTASMFRTAVQGAVLEAVDMVGDQKGVRRLSELERKPILRNFFDRGSP